MSINKFISIKNPIVDALDMVGGDKNKEMPIYINWAVKAEKRIGSPAGLKRGMKKVIPIKGCIAELPDSVVILERALLGDHGCECDDLFISIFNQGTTEGGSSLDVQGFLIVDLAQNSVSVMGIVPYKVQDNKIHFAKNHDGESVTIQYTGYEEDCDGFIKISENHNEAIQQFILWKYIERSRIGPNPQKRLAYEDKKDAEREWHRLCANARGLDAVLSEPEQLEIAAMLNDPYAGRGLVIGMSSYPNFMI